MGEDVAGFPRLSKIPAWDTLTGEQRQLAARKMEIYAAMVEYMDDQIGRLIAHLKATGKYDNTLIMFMSDNGAAGEDMGELVAMLAPTAKDWFNKTYDNRPDNWGRPGSCIEYGPSWAQVSSVPLRLFKGVETEGGIRSPLIVSGPGVKFKGAISQAVLHVMDIMPSFLELAGVEHPSKKEGGTLAPLQGKSLWPLLAGREQEIRSDSDWLGCEVFGNRAIRQGDWKLLYLLKGAGGTGDWELFNLKNDPAEMHDLSAEHPEKREAMLRLWDEYVTNNGVILSDAGPYAGGNPDAHSADE
jgi:arylsulfatase